MLYLGLISGTSADGIDAALVRFDPFCVVAARTFRFPEPWRELCLQLGQGMQWVDLDQLGQLDQALGEAFADAAMDLCVEADIPIWQITAIGSHGQTVRHRPNLSHPFTLQLGCAHVIAERTSRPVAYDFRRRDLAAGGQGAPLVPAFHAAIFPRGSAVLNLGGIANVSYVGESVLGFDTGPANCLLDAYAQMAFGVPCDIGGAIAATGRVDAPLLASLLEDPYFALAAPKSTGREHFNLAWLDQCGRGRAQKLPAADVQATLLQLTVQSVAHQLQAFRPEQLWVCGGGVHNPVLMRALEQSCQIPVRSTAALGVDPDFVEAAAFAWLARERIEGRTGNMCAVTGARSARVLGALTA